MSAMLRRSAIPKQKPHLPLSMFTRLAARLFLVGFLAACLCTVCLRDILQKPVASLFRDAGQILAKLPAVSGEVFFYSAWNYFKIFLLLFLFSLTNVWRPCCAFYVLFSGFTHGLFFSFCLLQNAAGGLLQYACFLLPQSLLLVPAFLLLIEQLEALHAGSAAPKNASAEQVPSSGGASKRQLLFSKLPLLLFCLLLLISCAFLEGYLNIPLLRHYYTK